MIWPIRIKRSLVRSRCNFHGGKFIREIYGGLFSLSRIIITKFDPHNFVPPPVGRFTAGKGFPIGNAKFSSQPDLLRASPFGAG